MTFTIAGFPTQLLGAVVLNASIQIANQLLSTKTNSAASDEQDIELTNAEIIMHEEDDKLFNSPEGREHAAQMGFAPSPDADHHVKDNDEIVIGDLKLKVIHTPGHSRGGICLYGDGNLFTGDTLFVGAIGRDDLPGGDYEVYMDSIHKKILPLPNETIVWPGHDYGMSPSSTIGREKMTNPFL